MSSLKFSDCLNWNEVKRDNIRNFKLGVPDHEVVSKIKKCDLNIEAVREVMYYFLEKSKKTVNEKDRMSILQSVRQRIGETEDLFNFKSDQHFNQVDTLKGRTIFIVPELLFLTNPMVPVVFDVNLEKNCNREVVIKCDLVNKSLFQQFELLPNIVQFEKNSTTKLQSMAIIAKTPLVEKWLHNQINFDFFEIKLMIMSQDESLSNISQNMKVNLIKPEGSQVYSCGTDDHCQLGTELSQQRMKNIRDFQDICKISSLLQDQDEPQVVFNLKNFGKPGESEIQDPWIEQEKKPEFTVDPKSIFWRDIGVGKYHSVIVNGDGSVYTWGCGYQGELGHKPYDIEKAQLNLEDGEEKEPTKQKATEDIQQLIKKNFQESIDANPFYFDHFIPMLFKPKRIQSLEQVKVIKVACGQFHTILLTDHQQLYSCGSNLHGQLGVGEEVKIAWEPIHLTKLKDEKIVSMSTGTAHTMALSIDGRVFGWGSNDKHQLGFPEKNLKCFQPTEFKGSQFAMVFCAFNASAGITKSKRLFLWGDNEKGQLGMDPQFGAQVKNPTMVYSNLNLKVKDVALGRHRTLFVTHDYKVYAMGSNEYGQLGIMQVHRKLDKRVKDKLWYYLTNVEYLNDRGIVMLQAGEYSSTAISYDGFCYTFGWNRFGMLGTKDKQRNRLGLPQLNEFLLGRPVSKFVSGFNHSLAIIQGQNEALYDPEFAEYKKKTISDEVSKRDNTDAVFCIKLDDLINSGNRNKKGNKKNDPKDTGYNSQIQRQIQKYKEEKDVDKSKLVNKQ